MRHQNIIATLFAVVFMQAGFVCAGGSADLQSIIADHWVWYLEHDPETRTHLGDMSAAGRWQDVSLAHTTTKIRGWVLYREN